MAFNILIVDDSETMRAVVKKVVSMSGVAVGEFLEAANGREALEILEGTWVDVILSDINMPEMNGIELLREINKNEVLKHVPVILITTEASQARMDEAARHGAAGYIKKPFVPETIKAVLLDVLEKAYAQRMQEEVTPEESGGPEENLDF
jgi:two-component system chemotaxis response regulator CheY